VALSARRRRQAAALAVALGVLGLHVAGLRAWAPASAPVASPRTAADAAPVVVPLQVRAVVPEPSLPPSLVMNAVAAGAPTVVSVAADAAPRDRAPATPPAEANGETASSATGADGAHEATSAPAAPEPAQPVTVAAASTGSAPNPPGEAAPIYPTALPPPFQSTFRMQRGVLAGTGTLAWELSDARYRLVLVGSVAGVSLLEWISQGGIDRAGVAPERFVSQTRGRSAQSVNFQRGTGKVTYSVSTAEHALPAGVQDRVSWLVQIAAVVAAAPERFAVPGADLKLPVAGARGVGLWEFVALGAQTIETPAGRIEALAFRREAKHAYDTRGEVWLDPRRHHLPVRVMLSTIDGNGRVSDSLALDLESTTP
jgi:hypothetical protein